MHLNKNACCKAVLIFLILSSIALFSQPAQCGEMDMVRSQFQNIINQMDGKDTWKQHIFRLSKFSYENLLMAIKELQSEYYGSVANMEQCVNEIEKLEKQHSNSWLRDLIEEFGLEFVQANEDDIVLCINAISVNAISNYCNDEVSKLMSHEAALYEGYRLFLNYFDDFYNSLEHNAQIEFAKQKEYIDAFKSLISHVSMASTIYGGILGKRAEIKAKTTNSKLYAFLVNHPDIKKIDKMKAREDLYKIIGSK